MVLGERKATRKARSGALFYGLVVLLFVSTLAWMIVEYVAARPPYVGGNAPEFELPLLNRASERLALSSLRGRPLLINFWSVTCPPCLEELPDMVDVYERYASRGFELVAINTDFDPQLEPLAHEYLAARSFPFPVAFDVHGDVALRYHVTTIPHSVFVGADGIVRKLVRRRMAYEELMAEVEALFGPPG